MSRTLEGKRTVITGGSRGLGLAMARAYLRAGARVVVASRSCEAISEAVASLRSEGGEALGVICDVGKWEQTRNLARKASSQWGGFDIWINNAGLSAAYGPTWELSMERIEAALRTNILGVAYGSWLAMQQFRAQGHGLLLNLLGRGTRRPSPFQNAYGSSKTWVRDFTRSLAVENDHPEIRVLAFNPGLLFTDLTEDVETVPGSRERLEIFSCVLGLLGNPPEVAAEKAIWLATEDGRRADPEFTMLSIPRLVWTACTRAVAALLGQRELAHPVKIEIIEPARPHPTSVEQQEPE